MQLFELIFRSFWTFMGTVILITASGTCIAEIISAWRNKEN
ncbi:LPS O-antigen subunit length determinant protein (WzzB/FepE family) [Variovorax boronicumulans]